MTRVVPAPPIVPPDQVNGPFTCSVPAPPTVPEDIDPEAVTVPVTFSVPPSSVTLVSAAPSASSNVPACRFTP